MRLAILVIIGFLLVVSWLRMYSPECWSTRAARQRVTFSLMQTPIRFLHKAFTRFSKILLKRIEIKRIKMSYVCSLKERALHAFYANGLWYEDDDPWLAELFREEMEEVKSGSFYDRAYEMNFFQYIIYVPNHEFEPKHEFTRQWFDRIENAEFVSYFRSDGKFVMEELYFPVTLDFFYFLLRGIENVRVPESWIRDEAYLEQVIDTLPDAYDFAGDFFRLLLSGDVELNPGPAYSKPVHACYNNPSVWTKVDLSEKKAMKVATLLRNLKREIKQQQQSGIECQSWHDGLRGFFGAPAKITTQAEKLISLLEVQLPAMEKSICSLVRDTVDKITSWKNDIAVLILVVILIYLLFKGDYFRSAIMVVLSSISYFFNFPAYIREMFTELRNAFKKENDIQQSQGAAEEILYHPWFGLCGRILFAVLAFVGIGAIPGKQDWDNYILRLDRIPKALEGTRKITAYCTEYFNAATDQLKMLILGKTKSELGHVHALYQEIREWANTVRQYMDLTERQKIDTNAKLANEVAALYKRGLNYQSMGITDQSINALISSTLFPAKMLFEYVASSPIKGGGMRMRAVTLWLNGASGMGKTLAVYPLCIDLIKAMGLNTSPDYGSHIYARYTETEFWDGYHNQKIVVYDDAFQRTDDVVNPNPELFEVIRSCNEFPQHIHMAALQDKNTYSTAEVLIYTSNDRNVKIKSLTHPDAFFTRMSDNAYDVIPAPGYGKEVTDEHGQTKIVLDKSKLDPTVAIDLKAYAFQKVVRTGILTEPWKNVGEPITFDELSKLICEQWTVANMRGFHIAQSLKQRLTAHVMPEYISNFLTNKPENIVPVTTPIGDIMELTREQIKLVPSGDFFQMFTDDIRIKRQNGKTMVEIEYDYVTYDELYAKYLEFRLEVSKRYESSLNPMSKWQKCAQSITKHYDVVCDKLSSAGKQIVTILKEHPILSVLGILGTILTAYGIYESFQWFTGQENDQEDDDINLEPEVGISGGHKTRNMQRLKVHATEDLRKTMIAQNGTDYNAFSLVTDALAANLYEMSYFRTKEVDGIEKVDRLPMGNVTFVTGHVFVMPYHYLQTFRVRDVPEGTMVCFSNPHHNDVFSIPVDFFFRAGSSRRELSDRVRRLKFDDGSFRDAVVVNVSGTSSVVHRNVLKHFIRRDEQSKIAAMGKHCATITSYRRVKNKTYDKVGPSYIWVQGLKPHDKEICIDKPKPLGDNDTDLGYYTQRESYVYFGPTNTGDCGALLAIFNNRIEKKILGMHIAGSKTDYGGYSVPLNYELIKQAIDEFPDFTQRLTANVCFEPPKWCVDETISDTPEGVFIPLPKAEKGIGMASKTALIPSCLYGKLKEPITKPAILKPIIINGELVDPLAKALKKSGFRTKWINEDELRAATNDVCRMVLTTYNDTIDPKKYQRLLTYEECVRGTLDDQFMKAIARSTSPGYPYVLENKGMPGKQRWMGIGDVFDFDSEDAVSLRNDVDQLLEDCANGIVRDVIWSDILKDERREIKKVEMGKTRAFAAAPQHFVVAFRKYFLGFTAFLEHNRIFNGIAVGTNPFSVDWELLHQKLTQVGSRVIAGDFGNFDGSLILQVLWACYSDIYVPWLKTFIDITTPDGQKHYRTTYCLWAHIVNSVHINGDNFYMLTHSQPSGGPLTAILNCLYNLVIMRIAWMIIMREHPEYCSMRKFNENVRMIVYGDDNVLNISDDVLPLYNQITITEALGSIGHEYTDEAKTGEMIESRTLDSVFFLKRGFRYDPVIGRHVAPLKIDVIYEMLNWTRNIVDPNVITLTNIGVAFREMFLHGPLAYQELVTAINDVVDALPERPAIPTYAECMTEFVHCTHALYRDYSDLF